jgi:hypothetical protein
MHHEGVPIGVLHCCRPLQTAGSPDPGLRTFFLLRMEGGNSKPEIFLAKEINVDILRVRPRTLSHFSRKLAWPFFGVKIYETTNRKYMKHFAACQKS